VFLLLLGLGDASKIAMIALILGYQILVTTRDGVRSIHPKYLDSVRSLGGSRLDVLREVLVSAALPHGFTALRLGTGVSVAVLFFVESFATTRGLGYMIMDAWGAMDYLGMFVGIIGMSLMGAALYELANFMERRVCRWMFLRKRM
jgi:NitT/TauT family transport system permease protein